MTRARQVGSIGWLATMYLALTAGPAPGAADEPVAPAVAELYTLVENGGFENGGASPDWWRRYPKADKNGNRILRDATVAHSGRASGLIWSVTPFEPGKPGMQWNRYTVDVEGGASLIASCWVKTEGCAPHRVGFHFYDAKRTHLAFKEYRFPAERGQWVYLREQVHVPADATKMGVALYAHPMGKTWFDDVAILGTPSAEAVRATPRVDGRLDDACWSARRAVTRFALHTGAGLPAEKTRAWLTYDDDALYVAFECPHAPGARLRAKAAKHDGDTWLDDSIEVFLDPDHDHRDYFQFAVNCRGVVRDSRGTDTAWNSGARAAVQRTERAWTVELAIPYDQLNLSLAVADTWGVNLVRNDRVRAQTGTWSLGGFHDATRFGNVAMQPNIWRHCRASLARTLAAKRKAIAGLLAEMQDAGMAGPAAAEPNRLVAKARAAMTDLHRLAGQDAPDATARRTAARLLAHADAAIAGARAAAVQSVFRAGEGKDELRVAIAHSLQKVRRDGPVVAGVLARRVSLAAARDEAESFQLVVIPGADGLRGVHVEAPALTGPGGGIPVQWHRVGYVETAPPKYPTEYVGWWPDPLLPAGAFDVKAGQRQPLWFDVTVPPEAKPGVYRGQVTIRRSGQAVRVPVELLVRSFRLPRPGTLATAFGNYASALSRGYYGRRPYRECLKIEDYKRWCEFMGRHRLSPKNTAREYIQAAKRGDGWDVDLGPLQTTVADLAPRYYAPYSFCLHRRTGQPVQAERVQAAD